MAEHNPSPPTPSAAKARATRCEDWECLIAEALDGTLPVGDSAALERHAEQCPGCAEMLEQARQGSAWLDLLKTSPEIPGELLSRILAQTGGAAAAGLQANADTLPPWWQGALPAAYGAHRSRFLMTAAMAFFSISLTLNLTSRQLSPVRFSNIARLSGLAPEALRSTLTRQYYAASEGVTKYYEDLPLVYEVKAEVRDLWRSAKPQPAALAPGEPRGSSRSGAPQREGAEPRGAPGAAFVALRNRRSGSAEGSAA